MYTLYFKSDELEDMVRTETCTFANAHLNNSLNMCHDAVRPNAMSSISFTTDSTFIKTNTLSWTTALWDCCNHTVNL